MIKVENAYKYFNGEVVLNDVSVHFEPGKTNLIIGQSGSGKTVLMKSIVGLYHIEKGSIYYHDRDFVTMTPKERQELRKEMGMLFQGSALFDSFNVYENVSFPLDMFSNMTKAEKNKRVDFCLERVNLPGVHKLFPAELSGGMQKRAAIARAIVQNPKYLFCDEPNSGLDPKTSLVIDALISDITHEYKMTTIINTHDMNSVIEIGEKVVFIYKGEKHWEGNSKEILDVPDDKLNAFIFASKLAQNYRKQ